MQSALTEKFRRSGPICGRLSGRTSCRFGLEAGEVTASSLSARPPRRPPAVQGRRVSKTQEEQRFQRGVRRRGKFSTTRKDMHETAMELAAAPAAVLGSQACKQRCHHPAPTPPTQKKKKGIEALRDCPFRHADPTCQHSSVLEAHDKVRKPMTTQAEGEKRRSWC
ncbi:hypothetical protein VUR80DRAFT_7420 [Thermomyces stellatus]